MSDDFEAYTQARIAQLRSQADALEDTLNDYRKNRGKPIAASFPLSGNVTPLRKSKRAPARARSGTKRGFVLARIGESVGGATTEELWQAISRAHRDMKRSSLRALLYLEVKSGNLERRGNRYVLKQDRPDAPTSGLSG